MRIVSPVRSQASPPPAALSGEALRIDGLSDVPDCRPSPSVGRLVMPRWSSASGGCMFTTSAEPGQPSGPEPRITRMLFSSIAERGIVDAVRDNRRSRRTRSRGPRTRLRARLAEIARAEFLRDHARLHDREVEQIALEDEEAGALLQRRVEAADHLAVVALAALRCSRPACGR